MITLEEMKDGCSRCGLKMKPKKILVCEHCARHDVISEREYQKKRLFRLVEQYAGQLWAAWNMATEQALMGAGYGTEDIVCEARELAEEVLRWEKLYESEKTPSPSTSESAD